MRERIAAFREWLHRRQASAALSESSSNRAVIRYLAAQAGPTLVGPLIIIISAPVTSGAGSFTLLGSGFITLCLSGVAGSVAALQRPGQAALFGLVAGGVLVVGIRVSVSVSDLATGFVGAVGTLLGFAGIVVGMVGHECVQQELRSTRG